MEKQNKAKQTTKNKLKHTASTTSKTTAKPDHNYSEEAVAHVLNEEALLRPLGQSGKKGG